MMTDIIISETAQDKSSGTIQIIFELTQAEDERELNGSIKLLAIMSAHIILQIKKEGVES